MLPTIKDALATKTFAQVGAEYCVTGQSVRNFLTRHGVDLKQYAKKPYGARHKEEVDEEGWPLPAKPEKTMTLAGAPAPEKPRMKFRKETVKNAWGKEIERDVPVPTGKYKDPETGAKVTKYPAGYAWGAHEQKNVSVKGGA